MRAFAFAAALLAFAAGGAFAQSVALQGTMGKKALLIVDGSEPKLVAPGESFKGVKVLATSGDTATLEAAGQHFTLRVGDSQASVGGSGPAAGSGSKIVLTGGSNGHYVTLGAINGRSAQFVVDTGASTVAMGEAEAKRLGIAFEGGPPVISSTANGNVTAHMVSLTSVRIGDVEVRNVEATVLPAAMPYILLGNSFLSRFSMHTEADKMTLERRY